jgi:hypothetical protein
MDGEPMKRWLSLTVSILALAAMPLSASADQPSVHYGPISSGTTDSGTCGNNWANDTYKRSFDAATSPNADGTYSATETFIAARFVTVAGPSPDACDPTGVKGSTIAAGVTGSFSGNFMIVVAHGTFDPNATCDSGCDTTAGFVHTIYGASATYNVPSFGFTYHANGADLIQREWHNASADQGGNSGDIRSS